MRSSLVILAAVALAACGPRVEESGGEVVVDTTIDNSKVMLEMDSTLRDTVGLPPTGADTGLRKHDATGRKPVDMKDSLRRY